MALVGKLKKRTVRSQRPGETTDKRKTRRGGLGEKKMEWQNKEKVLWKSAPRALRKKKNKVL